MVGPGLLNTRIYDVDDVEEPGHDVVGPGYDVVVPGYDVVGPGDQDDQDMML